jgi:hypothetical protein
MNFATIGNLVLSRAEMESAPTSATAKGFGRRPFRDGHAR